MKGINEVNLPFKLFKKGKVRDVYEIDNNLLIVSTDRISAFDFVLPSVIPDKGKVLNQISVFWFDKTSEKFPNHIISSSPENLDQFKEISHLIEGRSILGKKLNPFPIEAIVRNYIVGSGWKSYLKDKSICGVELPENLSFGEKLEEPIFTPTTKEDDGHDENITFKEMENRIGKEYAENIRKISIDLFKTVSEFALSKDIIIADTKFEFGMDSGGSIILIDEIFTPDSSRFWKIENYSPGIDPPAFDKQYVRNFLLNSDWDKKTTPPPLPQTVIEKTREKYLEIFTILTGKSI